MIRFLVSLFFVSALHSFIHAETGDVIKLAGEAYARKEYTAAISLYEQAIEEGDESPELYYNLGNACYRSEQIGPAVFFFEKAMKYLPADTAVRHNLRLAYSRIPDQAYVPKIEAPGWKEKVFGIPGEAGWSWICICLFSASILLYSISYLRSGMKKTRILAHVLLLFCIGSFYIAMSEKNRIAEEKYAIVLSPEVMVVAKQQHEMSSRKIVLHEGTRVEIIQRRFGWCRVAFGKDAGWVPEQVLGII